MKKRGPDLARENSLLGRVHGFKKTIHDLSNERVLGQTWNFGGIVGGVTARSHRLRGPYRAVAHEVQPAFAEAIQFVVAMMYYIRLEVGMTPSVDRRTRIFFDASWRQ